MKKIFLLMASATMLFTLACQPEPQKDEPKEEEKEQEDPGKEDPGKEDPKSTECKILSFSVEAGGLEFEGTIYDQENAVVLEAFPEQLAFFQNVTNVTYTISEKATISPDPATVTDFSSSPTFTVTAEDGKTTKRYVVDVEEARFEIAIAVREGQKDPVAVETIGASNDFVKMPGNQVAFIGSDLIATADGRVYDLDLNYKGDLNREGIAEDLYIGALGNDENGVLIAAYVGGPEIAPAAITSTFYYAYLEGWDKAPVGFYMKDGAGNYANYMNVCGDAFGRMLITAAYASGDAVHAWYFDYDATLGKPQTSGDRWSEFAGGPAGGAASYIFGGSAGKSVSPVTADKNSILVWSVTRGQLSEADPNYSAHLGDGAEENLHWKKDGGAGAEIAVRQGRDGVGDSGKSWGGDDFLHLRGTVHPDAYKVLRYGGLWGWGNLASPANIKAFTLDNNLYVAVGHSGWGKSYFTVVDVANSTESENAGAAPEQNNTAYLLRTQAYDSPKGAVVSVSYMADPAIGGGHIAVIYGHNDIEGSDITRIQVWDIFKKKI
ncbi:MAG: DUF5018 domain-containing protein [Bacteroidales bacterium]|nr:DUF5018 domain-containing protein [Bacteroidales bacterium]